MPSPAARLSARLLKQLALLLWAVSAYADTAYYQRVFFDNSINRDFYFYSEGRASAPSLLELSGDRLPVDADHFHTPPNALRLHWRSVPQGGWAVSINLYEFRNREIFFPGDRLTFWCYSPQDLKASDLPRVTLHDSDKNFTRPLNLAKTIPARQWTKVLVPLDQFATASVHPFNGHRVDRILFSQGASDGSNHILFIDDMHIESPSSLQSEPPTVEDVTAHGYERHVDVSWNVVDNKNLEHYLIYRSLNGSTFRPIGIQVPGIHRFADWLGKPAEQATYKVIAETWEGKRSKPSSPASAETHAMTDDELLTMVQEACFHYYWDGAHPSAGMTRENLPGNDDIVATGASGFGIMALVVGVDREFITRQQGVERLLQIVRYLAKADRYHGVWPHFTNGQTGERMPVFGLFDNGADLVETSFLMEGLLSARQYFDRANPQESLLRDKIAQLWKSVDWSWFRRTPDGDALFWHWSPEYSWYINHRLTGFNETMITYLLGIASPTYGVPASLYYSGWASDHYANGHTYYGIKLDVGVGDGGPLFFTQYSYLGFDPRVRDKFTNYFDNNRNQALINQQFCIRNPEHFEGYGPNCWGITAVDGPEGYNAYEPKIGGDDGTIAPTGAIAAFPYTPQASMLALKHYYRDLGSELWGEFGFRDAFNLQRGWFSGIYMGLNQAPMVVMIENYRTGLVWKKFMSDPEMQAMRRRVFEQ